MISLVFACIALSISHLIIIVMYIWLEHQVQTVHKQSIEKSDEKMKQLKSYLVKESESTKISLKTIDELESKDRESKQIIDNSFADIRVLLEENHNLKIKEYQ